LFAQQFADLMIAPVFPFIRMLSFTLKPYYWKLTGTKAFLLPDWFKHAKQFLDPSIPLSITVHNSESEYIKAFFLFDVSGIEVRLRYYLMVFIELIFSSASNVDGHLKSSSEFKRILNSDVLEYGCHVGFGDVHQNIVQLSFEVGTLCL
jgi:hypothetical protein